ncbi:uncharacterized protein G2W53_005414 [Senna tora]|uniref:Uncharacterized protein n=1 Tax=Senna tora TaxID=362788 RepID=A0A834X237_9FABA|nr:uncharacterized protein G2W53_005414 [Senna tora]
MGFEVLKCGLSQFHLKITANPEVISNDHRLSSESQRRLTLD